MSALIHTHKLTTTMKQGVLVVYCKRCGRPEAEIKEAR